MPETPRVFISFDFDHDDDLRNLLVGQAKHPNSPFNISKPQLKHTALRNQQGRL